MNSNRASDDPDRGPDPGCGADGGCGCSCDCRPAGGTAGGGRTGSARVAPAGDGVAPTRGEVAGIDWSGGAEAAAVGRLLDTTASIDRLRVEQVEALVQVIESGAAEQVLGVAVEVVLSQSGRIAREQSRRLLRAAHTLARMPAVRHGFRQGWLSWSQVDAICWHVRDVHVDRLAGLDELVGAQAAGQADVEADALVADVEWVAARITAAQRADRKHQPVEANRVVLQPRLDGSGDMHASYDALRFPIMAERIDRVARDLAEVPDPPTDAEAETMSDAALSDAHRHAAKVAAGNAARRAAALFGLVTGWGEHGCRVHAADMLTPAALGAQADDMSCWDHDSLEDLDGDVRPHPDGRGPHEGHHGAGPAGCPGAGGCPAGTRARRPAVLLTAELDSLLDGTTPAHVLTRLTGRMRVTAEVARRWVQAHGADVRLIVMEDGQPVGVGRRTRIPPGWLRDAILARDLHDTAPCSTTAGPHCDIDHTIPFDDDHPEAGGATDVTNLALLSRRWHTKKTRGQLRLDRHADGTATWRVTATGYQVHTGRPAHLSGPTVPDPPAVRWLRDIPAPDHHDDVDGRAPP